MRELLHECSECHKDYPARRWHADGITRAPGLQGWICPRGHTLLVCDPGTHEWQAIDETGEQCRRCDAWRLRGGELMGNIAELTPLTQCSSCGAWIYWLKNIRTGKLGPLNASPDAGLGNCKIDIYKGEYGAFGPREAAQLRAAGELLHTSHFATCPQRATWKKRGSVR